MHAKYCPWCIKHILLAVKKRGTHHPCPISAWWLPALLHWACALVSAWPCQAPAWRWTHYHPDPGPWTPPGSLPRQTSVWLDTSGGWLPITRLLTGRPPLSNDCSDLPPSLHLLLQQRRQTLLCCFFPQNACQILTLLKTALNIWFFQPHKHIWRPGFFFWYLLYRGGLCLWNAHISRIVETRSWLHQMHIL